MDSQTDDGENKTGEREYLKEECIHKVSEKVTSKLKRVLSPDMPGYYRSNALSKELEVWILINVITIQNGVFFFRLSKSRSKKSNT